MKYLLAILTLCAALSSCGARTTHYGASLNALVPPQVGNYTAKDGLKQMKIEPPDKYRTSGLYPTEGLEARYEKPDGSQVNFQLINYGTADNAGKVLRQMEENFRNFTKAEKIRRSPVSSKEWKGASEKVVVENLEIRDPEKGGVQIMNEVMWADKSLFYHLSGKNLDAIKEFERNLP